MDTTAKVENLLNEITGLSVSLFLDVPHPILVLNKDTSLKYVNPAFESLTGFRKADIIDTSPPFPWWSDNPRTFGNLKKASREKRFHATDFFHNVNGTILKVELDIIVFEVCHEPQYYVEYWDNITDEKSNTDRITSYLRRVTKEQDSESKRIAMELHDGLAQRLANLCTESSMIARIKDLPSSANKRIEDLCLGIRECLDDLRRLCSGLTPAALERFGLVPALEMFIEDKRKETSATIFLQSVTAIQKIEPEVALHLFRLTQEALNNAIKHAKPTRVTVSVGFTSDDVEIVIRDNGIGFNYAREIDNCPYSSKLGLLGMRERVDLLGGTIKIDSVEGSGTTIKVKVPKWIS